MKHIALLCLALATCNVERVPHDEAMAALAAFGSKPPFEGTDITIPRDGRVSFGRNPRHHIDGYEWRIEKVATDAGVETHIHCSGRLVIAGVLASDYLVECRDTEEELPR